jgi:hypothetical protein
MSYYFDNNSRYQIIHPYTSDKIHVEPSIDHGAYRCYQELKDRDIITYIFIVHDIDAGTLYYFNIPKNKHLDATQNLHVISKNKSPDPNPHNTQSGSVIPCSLPTQSINIINPANPSIPMVNALTDYGATKQNDIITRLNHVEYQLDVLKKRIQLPPKKEEEDGCVIM